MSTVEVTQSLISGVLQDYLGFLFHLLPTLSFRIELLLFHILSPFYKCWNLRGVFYSDFTHAQLRTDVSALRLLCLLRDSCTSGLSSGHFSPMPLQPSLLTLPLHHGFPFLRLNVNLATFSAFCLHHPLQDFG